jgi:hypothetical protein
VGWCRIIAEAFSALFNLPFVAATLDYGQARIFGKVRIREGPLAEVKRRSPARLNSTSMLAIGAQADAIPLNFAVLYFSHGNRITWPLRTITHP